MKAYEAFFILSKISDLADVTKVKSICAFNYGKSEDKNNFSAVWNQQINSEKERQMPQTLVKYNHNDPVPQIVNA